MGLISGRQTKIVWSFKSKALTKDLPKSIAESAADAVRLVYTPGSDDKLLNFLKDVREYEQGRSRISAMLDITPQARAKLIGLEEPKELRHGEQIFLSVNPEKATHLKIEAEDWQNLFTIGSKVFFGYGNVVLTVEEIKNEVTTCRVLQGGTAYPRMEIHVPSTRKPPSLNHLTDLNINEFSRVGVDYVVLPGFSESREIEFIRRRILKASDELPWIILKIDNKGVYEKLEGLLPLVDGVMISRRELALTLEPASIPMITKEVVQLCNNHAKLVLIASEILGSMRYNPTPTRAEVSDIANCVMDGADAVVLSEDICRGIYSKRL
ncbi:MAG: pyruvate kinase [Bdellovibrionota bacterium]